MGFVKSMLSNSRGAGWNAQQDPNALNRLNEQYGVIQGAQGQLQQLALGQGPNPALAQLQQTTDENIAQNAGFISSQKGINPALAARLAAQNAGQMNQQAAGQAAVQSANQQLGAIGQLGSLAGNTQANIQSGINGANAANASMAGQNASGQFGILNGIGSTGLLLGSKYLGLPTPTQKAHGGLIGPASAVGRHMALMDGGQIPGQAKVAGDSYSNDTVPAMLSPKEIVLPRSVTLAPDAPKRAAEFVARVLASNGLRKKG